LPHDIGLHGKAVAHACIAMLDRTMKCLQAEARGRLPRDALIVFSEC
jgi:hypothetical protein